MISSGETAPRQKTAGETPLRQRLIRAGIAFLVSWGIYTGYHMWRTLSAWERAKSLYEAGDYPRAVLAFRKHLELDPDDAYSHYWFANALGFSGHLEEAVAQFRRAVELEAGNSEYHAGLANALWMQKRYPQAEQSYGTAISLEPKNPQWRTELGFLFLNQGKRREAKTTLHQALEIDPSYEHALLGIQMLNEKPKQIAPSEKTQPRFRRQMERT
jgi:Flp pilus assembly protein TadD